MPTGNDVFDLSRARIDDVQQYREPMILVLPAGCPILLERRRPALVSDNLQEVPRKITWDIVSKGRYEICPGDTERYGCACGSGYSGIHVNAITVYVVFGGAPGINNDAIEDPRTDESYHAGDARGFLYQGVILAHSV